MSQQINLYDSKLLREREWLTIANLAAAVGVLLLALGGWGALVRSHVATLEAESQVLAPQIKELQDQVLAVGKQMAEVRSDPKLEANLAAARDLLVFRSEIVAVLKKGVGPESIGFAEYLRGLARQTPHGLWLTGFTVGDGGASMTIRGRMTDPALLPEYIQRLNGENGFKGRAFAALDVAAGHAEPAVQNPPVAGAPPAGSDVPAPFYEFTLTPVPAEAKR